MIHAAPSALGPVRVAPWLTRTFAATAATGGVAFVASLVLAPDSAWAGFLVAFHLFTGLALAGPLFVALLTAAGARWWTPVRRVPEAMASAIPAAAGLGIVMLLGATSLFEWSHPALVERDPVLAEKSAWLNVPFFSARLVVCFALWFAAWRWLASARPGSKSAVARSAAFVAVFAVTYSVASVDWLMSLEPHWASTIYALLTLAGLGLSGLAVATIAVVLLRRAGPGRGAVTDDLLHDLGRLLFSLAMFWGYVRFCQWMLIWYTNIPEEAAWIAARQRGGWGALAVVNALLNCGIPFAALLFRATRRSGKALLRVAAVILVGRVTDLFVLGGPALPGCADGPGLLALLPPLGALGLFGWIFVRGLEREERPAPSPGAPGAAAAGGAAPHAS